MWSASGSYDICERSEICWNTAACVCMVAPRIMLHKVLKCT